MQDLTPLSAGELAGEEVVAALELLARRRADGRRAGRAVDPRVDRAVLLAGLARHLLDEPGALLAQALAAGERRLLDGDRRRGAGRAGVPAERRERRARLGLGGEQLHRLGEDRVVRA